MYICRRESKRRRKPLRKDSEDIDPYEFEDDDVGLRKPTGNILFITLLLFS